MPDLTACSRRDLIQRRREVFKLSAKVRSSLSEIQRLPVSALFRLSDRSNNFVALFKLDIARGHAGPHFRDDPPWKVLVRWITFVVNSSRNFQVLKSQQLQALPRVTKTVSEDVIRPLNGSKGRR